MYSAPAFAAQKYTACAKVKTFTPQITVNLSLPDPSYNFSLNRKELNAGKFNAHQAWLQANGMESVWKADEMETLGQAAGGWQSVISANVVAVPYDRFGTSYCPYIKTLDVGMIYLSSITIPKEFKQGGCAFTAIMAHEWKHHVANATVAHEITERLKRDLPQIITEIETSGSYVSKSEAKARFAFMQEALKDVVKVYMLENMREEMRKRNALIDTPEEYERTGKIVQACKD